MIALKGSLDHWSLMPACYIWVVLAQSSFSPVIGLSCRLQICSTYSHIFAFLKKYIFNKTNQTDWSRTFFTTHLILRHLHYSTANESMRAVKYGGGGDVTKSNLTMAIFFIFFTSPFKILSTNFEHLTSRAMVNFKWMK